jgi:hypothetical protein
MVNENRIIWQMKKTWHNPAKNVPDCRQSILYMANENRIIWWKKNRRHTGLFIKYVKVIK